jgi:hypothetical protein
MKLSGSSMTSLGNYALRVEPGESVNITFHPDGVNALSGDYGLQIGLTIRSFTLPGGDLALALLFNDDLLHKHARSDISGDAELVLCRNFGAQRLEFVLSSEVPNKSWTLEKINLQALLKPASEEPSDG